MSILAFTIVELLIAIGVVVVIGGVIIAAIGGSARVLVTPATLTVPLNTTAPLSATPQSKSWVFGSWAATSAPVNFAASGVKVGINGPKTINATPTAPAVATIAGVAEGNENVTVSVTIGKDKGSVAVPVTVV